MKAYSIDLRERVLGACKHWPTQQVAKQFSVSPAWVRRLKQHLRERGDILPRTGGGSRGRKIDRVQLAQLVKEQPDATLLELRDRLVARGGKKVTPWAISKALRELKLSFKKSRSMPPSRIVRTWQRVVPPGG
jgi:transposase